MKKILILGIIVSLCQSSCFAKDYAKQYMKQMKKNHEYRIENTYIKQSSNTQESQNLNIKDPKLIKLGNYEEISSKNYKAKLAKDNAEYDKIAKFLASRKLNEYYMQAYGEDFYKVYRIVEKIIRANKLDFMNWRISISTSNDFNAFNSDTNSITIHTAAIDTFIENEDALALLIGHELAHGLMGHAKRQAKYNAKIKRALRIGSYSGYLLALRVARKQSRDMEFEADIEGAKLAAKAGYDLSKAQETLNFLNTLYYEDEATSTHPKAEKRIENYEQNRKYFLEDEWKKQGEYNIYKSDVLKCEKSSNRNSLIITRGKYNGNSSYNFETIEDMYLRYGYKSYLSGDFKEAIKHFNDYLKYNKGNYTVYLYTSYTYEYLYKQTGNDKYLKLAKEFADYAKKLSPDNKYVKEQILAL